MIIVISLICLVIILDQVFKYLSMVNLIGERTISWFIFEFSYVENKSMLYNLDLTVVMIILSIVVLFIFIKFFFDNYTKIIRSRYNYIPFILIIGGAISNIMDRIARSFVIDYIAIPSIFKDTVFNFADICLSAGIVFMAVYYLIKVSEEKVITEETKSEVETGNNNNEDSSK